jgi:ubiquitin-small subunit ribosomal protein S27Ae
MAEKGDKKPAAGAAAKKKGIVKIANLYDKGKAKRQACPKCGPGVFMAEHKNRLSCGKCGYTTFKK